MFSILLSDLNFRNGKLFLSPFSMCFISFLLVQLCSGHGNEDWIENAQEKSFNPNDYNEDSPFAELKVLMTDEFKKMNERLINLEKKFENIFRYMNKRIDRVGKKVSRDQKKTIENLESVVPPMENLAKVDFNLTMSYTFSKGGSDGQNNSSVDGQETLPIKKIKGTNLYSGVYYQIGMKSFPGGRVTLANQTDQVSYLIIDNPPNDKIDSSRFSFNNHWMFEETENEDWYTLRNRGIPNGLATWSSTKRGSGYHLSMTISDNLNGGNVLWRPEPSNQENFYSIKMKDFPSGVVTWTYDKYDGDSHYLIVATKAEDMAHYLPGEKWYDDKLYHFDSPPL